MKTWLYAVKWFVDHHKHCLLLSSWWKQEGPNLWGQRFPLHTFSFSVLGKEVRWKRAVVVSGYWGPEIRSLPATGTFSGNFWAIRHQISSFSWAGVRIKDNCAPLLWILFALGDLIFLVCWLLWRELDHNVQGVVRTVWVIWKLESGLTQLLGDKNRLWDSWANHPF